MAGESTQRHTGESTTTPAAHHRTSSQDDIPLPKKQPRRQNTWSSQSIVQTLANVLCLLVGLWYIWTTHDLLGFILLYALATGAINAREVVGKWLSVHSYQTEELENHHQDESNGSEEGEEPHL